MIPNWIFKNFGNITIEQILFTLSLPLKGTSGSLIKDFIDNILFSSLKYSICIILVLFIIYDIKYSNKTFLNRLYKPLTFIFSKLVHITNFLKNKKKIINIFIILVFLILISLQIFNFIFPIKRNKFYYSNKQVINENCLIAHACGQIDDKTDTNSLEAIIKSINNGYKFIEIDLCLTKDNEIVAMHDFKKFNKMTNTTNDFYNVKEIKKQKIYNKYTPLTAEDINQIFTTNKDLFLVTDKIEDYDILLKNFKFTDRMIVEVFSIDDYKKALKKGILYPALCFCSNDLIKDIIKYNVKIVTTHIDFFNKNK
ncbi:MAG: hypothetical protein IKN42_05720, partial [Elusimicrobia bacterium]|nr:hypothetical protein [Elusimicrobiota bacterium]